MFRVVKRDGEVADFNLSKVSEAMTKAFDATSKEYNTDIIDLLSLRVTADFQSKIKGGEVHVEDIQDSVESVLDIPMLQKRIFCIVNNVKRCVT